MFKYNSWLLIYMHFSGIVAWKRDLVYFEFSFNFNMRIYYKTLYDGSKL